MPRLFVAIVLVGLVFLAPLGARAQCVCCVDVSARVVKTTDQSFPVLVETAVVFDSEQFDTGNTSGQETTTGIWKQTSPTQLTVPTAGKYLITGNVDLSGAGSNLLRIRKNGTRVAQMHYDDGDFTESITTYQQFAAGDVIDMTVYSLMPSGTVTVHGATPPPMVFFVNPPTLSIVKMP